MTNGWISWDRKSCCTFDLNKELEHWHNRLHKVSTLQCNMMTKSLRCASSKVTKLPYYDGLTNVDMFLDEFEPKIPEDHRFQALELMLRITPTRWWGMHKHTFLDGEITIE